MNIKYLTKESRRESPLCWTISVGLLLLILWLFAQLWVGVGTLPGIFFVSQDISAQQKLNQVLRKENDQRIAQIQSLKGGDEELEVMARRDIGMLKPGEIFYEIPSAEST